MNNVLLMLGALLVGVLAALVAVPMVIDWNGYRGVFEEEASRLMGRDVRVGGAVNVRILPVPYVRFEKLRIADINSTGGDPLFRAESVTMRLSITPLLRGVLEAQSVELKKPQLRLAVDAEGRGNWRSLSLKAGALPFVPADVSLQSVGITGGTLLFVSASGKELADFQDVEGELSADTFEGPFKFKGTSKWYGEARELRFGTAKPEPDGATRVRASVRVPATQNSYQFDGRLLDLKGRPHIDGELTAKLPVVAAKTARPAGVGGDDGNAFELKAKVDGDLAGGRLADIALSLDRVGDPQLITGDVTAAWGDGQRFNMALASKSLNLDWLSGEGVSRDPLEVARAALNVVLASLPLEAQTDVRLKADRVTLAGELVNGVTVAINRRGGTLDVKELKAILPGNTRLDASGTITRDQASSAFSGPVTLRGANFAKFAAWARNDALWARNDATLRPTAGAARGPYDGPFLVDGQLALSAGTIALTGASAEFSDQPVTGEFRFSSEGRRRVAVVLQGQQIDAALLWPGGLDTDRLRALLTGAPVTDGLLSREVDAQLGTVTRAGFYGFNPDTMDLSLDVRAAELRASAALTLRDVDAKITVDRGKLTVTRTKFQTANGLAVDLDGQISGLGRVADAKDGGAKNGSAAKRDVIHFVVGAPNAAAAGDLVSALDLQAANRPSDATLAGLGPVRMAGSATFGLRSAGASEWALDGTIDGGRVVAAVALDTGFKTWRSSALDLMASIDTANAGRWLALAGIGTGKAAKLQLAKSGQLFLKATGVPLTGVTTLATVTMDDLSVAYQGQVRLPKEGEIAAEGAAGIAARESGDVLALIDLPLGQGATGLSLQGQVVVKANDGSLVLSARDLLAGTARVNGSVTLGLVTRGLGSDTATGRAGDPPRALHADLTIDTASMAGLLAVIADRRNVGAVSLNGPTSVERLGSVWPDQPVSFAVLDQVQGDVRLAIGRLDLDGVPVLTNAGMKLRLMRGLFEVDELTGTGFGGAVGAKLALQRTPEGGQLTGDLRLADGKVGEGVPVSVTATVTGQGLSPSSLMAGLQGKGEVALGAGSVKGVGPSGVVATVDAVLAGKTAPSGEEIASLLRDQLAGSSLVLTPRSLGFAISNGVARLLITRFAAPGGSTTVESVVDLNRLAYVTDWRIEAAAKPGVTGKAKAPHAAVVVTLTGLLTALEKGERKLGLGAFEQELGLRKLERDGEELERVRKLDEELRRKEEADRVAAEAAAKAAELAKDAAAAAKDAQAAPAGGWAPVDAGGIRAPAPVEAIRPQTGVSGGGAAGTVPAGEVAVGTNGGAGHSLPQGLAGPSAGTSEATRLPTIGRRRAQEGISAPLQNNF